MRYMRVSVSVAATLWVLVEARAVLEPLFIAIFLWFLLNAVASAWTRYVPGFREKPTRMARAISGLLFVCLLIAIAVMIANNASDLGAKLQGYEDEFDDMISNAARMLGVQEDVRVGELLGRVQLSSAVLEIAGSAAGAVASVAIILIYIIFLFVEDEVAEKKLAKIFAGRERQARVAELIEQVNHEIQRYFLVKLVLGIVQAVPTYIVLKVVGVDGAAFWAVVIFFFSFVPTVGSLVGTVFPAVVALLQFDGLTPFLIVAISLGVLQVTASNWMEPRLMGSSLNLSPLVILIAIFAGGTFWGIVGALIVVPMLAVAVIIFARIPSLRPVAILLSRDGELHYGPSLAKPKRGKK